MAFRLLVPQPCIRRIAHNRDIRYVATTSAPPFAFALGAEVGEDHSALAEDGATTEEMVLVGSYVIDVCNKTRSIDITIAMGLHLHIAERQMGELVVRHGISE